MSSRSANKCSKERQRTHQSIKLSPLVKWTGELAGGV